MSYIEKYQEWLNHENLDADLTILGTFRYSSYFPPNHYLTITITGSIGTLCPALFFDFTPSHS